MNRFTAIPFGVFICFLATNLSAQEYAVATFVKGKVHVLSAADTSKLWKAIKVNETIRPGDKIKTGNGSKVDFIFKESEIRLQSNTEIVLEEWNAQKQTSKIFVEEGATWFKAKDFKKGSFSVSTPTSVAGVRGTAFGVYYEKKEKVAYNCVCEGSVEINGTLFSKGTGGSVSEVTKEVTKNEYKDLVTKEGATLKFKEMKKRMPMLDRCLPCHKPIGWEDSNRVPDEKYGN